MDIIKYFEIIFYSFFCRFQTKITIEYPCVYYFVVANQIYCSRFPHYIDFPENIAMRAVRFGHYFYEKRPSFMLFCRFQTKITIVYKHIFFFVFKPNLQQYIPSFYWFSTEYDHESIVILTLFLSKKTICSQNYNRISVFSFVLVTPNLQCYIYSFFSTEYGHERSVILTLFLSIFFFFNLSFWNQSYYSISASFFFICRFQAKFTIVYPLTLSFFHRIWPWEVWFWH